MIILNFIFNAILIGMLLVGAYIYETRPYTPSMIRGKDWIPNNSYTCGMDECHGIIAFNTPGCYLKDDGIIYDNGKPTAQLIGSEQPFIGESAPRTGSYVYFKALGTKSVCEFESTF